MNEILDYNEKDVSTNYRKWAFRFFIYLIILNFAIFYTIVDFTELVTGQETLKRKLLIANWIGNLLFIAVLFFCGMMIKFKEPKDYKYWTPLVGISLYIVGNAIYYFI